MAQRKPKKPKKPVKAKKLEPSVAPRTKPRRHAEAKASHDRPTELPEFQEETPADPGETSAADTVRFPVVVIGASAGGLAAMEPLFEHLPPDCGMAFVVVTHQSSDHSSFLPELLAKFTGMHTQSIVSGTTIAPNCVFVLPPGHWLLFKGDQLHLQAFDKPHGGPLPIDAAFRSLAHAHAERSIAIVLSGNGSDGSLGLTEVKSAFGMVIAQGPTNCAGRWHASQRDRDAHGRFRAGASTDARSTAALRTRSPAPGTHRGLHARQAGWRQRFA
jgi:chemotaxis response regulator CheB